MNASTQVITCESIELKESHGNASKTTYKEYGEYANSYIRALRYIIIIYMQSDMYSLLQDSLSYLSLFHIFLNLVEHWLSQLPLIPIFRLWTKDKSEWDPPEAQQLGYLTVVPQNMSSSQGKPQYEMLSNEYLNQHLTLNPIPGTMLSNNYSLHQNKIICIVMVQYVHMQTFVF